VKNHLFGLKQDKRMEMGDFRSKLTQNTPPQKIMLKRKNYGRLIVFLLPTKHLTKQSTMLL